MASVGLAVAFEKLEEKLRIFVMLSVLLWMGLGVSIRVVIMFSPLMLSAFALVMIFHMQ